jgi:RNA polymerase-binding transcription factor DksA
LKQIDRRAALRTHALIHSDKKNSDRVPAKWAQHYRMLLALRERLLGQGVELLEHTSEPLESHSMDIANSATDEFEHELALTRLSGTEDTLFEIDAAIRRILNGTYGICEKTGRPIPEARLKAVHWARE